MNRVLVFAVPGLIGGLLLLFGGGSSGGGNLPDRADVLGQCYVSDRAAKSAILAEMASKEFRNDDEQADWLNAEIGEATSEAMEPFVEQVAEAIINETVADLAEAIK